MHPDDRPASIAELRAELMAPGLLSRTASRVFDREWALAQFVRANRVVLAILAALLLAATLLTAVPRTLPPPAAPTLSPTAAPTLQITGTPGPGNTATGTPPLTPTPGG